MEFAKRIKLVSILIRLSALFFLSSSLMITVGCDTRDWYLFQFERLSFDYFNITLLSYQLILLLVMFMPHLPIWLRLIPVILFYTVGYFFVRASFCEEIHNAIFYFCIILSGIYSMANLVLFIVGQQNSHVHE